MYADFICSSILMGMIRPVKPAFFSSSVSIIYRLNHFASASRIRRPQSSPCGGVCKSDPPLNPLLGGDLVPLRGKISVSETVNRMLPSNIVPTRRLRLRRYLSKIYQSLTYKNTIYFQSEQLCRQKSLRTRDIFQETWRICPFSGDLTA